MDDVKIPEQARFVADPVKPIIRKVIQEKKDDPRPPGIRRKSERGIRISGLVNYTDEQAKYKTKGNAGKPDENIVPRILPVIVGRIRAIRPPRFQCDSERKKWYSYDNGIEHAGQLF